MPEGFIFRARFINDTCWSRFRANLDFGKFNIALNYIQQKVAFEYVNNRIVTSTNNEG